MNRAARILSLVVTVAVALPLGRPAVANATSGPATTGAILVQNAPSLRMATRASWYLWGFATGGAVPTQVWTGSPGATVSNAAGNVAAGFQLTHHATARVVTAAAYTVLGGVGIQHAASVTTFSASNGTPGATGVTLTVPVAIADSMVVVLAMGASEQTIRIAGLPHAVPLVRSQPQGSALAMEIVTVSRPVCISPFGPGSFPRSGQDHFLIRPGSFPQVARGHPPGTAAPEGAGASRTGCLGPD